jgi:hemolysin activation/secretion protein
MLLSGPFAAPVQATEPAAVQNATPLAGVVLLPAASHMRPGGVPTPADGLALASIPWLDSPETVAALRPLLGQPISPALLEQLTRTLVARSRAVGRSLIDVTVPAGQDVTDGVIQVVVTVFTVGIVRAEGNRWFGDRILTAAIRQQPGQPVDDAALRTDLARLNNSPFRSVELVYARGATPGTTDIILRTSDRLPLSANLGFDNSGTTATGRTRWTAALSWGNALGQDHQASYQFSSSSRYFIRNRLTAPDRTGPLTISHSGNYTLTLPWTDTLRLSADYSRSDPRTGNILFRNRGLSQGFSLSYSAGWQLDPTAPAPTQVQADLSYDYKRSNNALAFGGTTVSDTGWDIHQLNLSFSLIRPDSWGRTRLTTQAVFSPGGISSRNSNTAFESGRSRAAARYVYGRLSLDRTTLLPWNFVWTLRAQGQLTTARLQSSEQLTAGGAGTGRGYEVGVVAGDRGALISTEIQSPMLSPLGLLGLSSLGSDDDNQFQLLGFVDFATAHLRAPDDGEDPASDLLSAGVGLRGTVAGIMTIRLDYGWQLKESGNLDSPDRFAHLTVNLGY